MIIRLLFVSIILFLTVQSFGQDLKKGFILYSNKKYDKAINTFEKGIEKRIDVAAAKYGLALVYADENYSKHSNIKAYRNAKSAKESLEKMPEKLQKKYYENYQMEAANISEIMENIANKEFLKLPQNLTNIERERFIINFQGSEKAKEMSNQLVLMEYQNACEKNTIDQWQLFLRKHSSTIYYNEAQQKYENLWRNIYNNYASEFEFGSIIEFEMLYPDYPFKDEKYITNRQIMQYGESLNLYMGYIENNKEGYEYYIKFAAPNELAFVAIQRLMIPFIKNKQWDKAIDLLENYKPKFPDDKRFNQLIDIFKAPDMNIESKSISSKINTQAHEYAPVMTANNKILYFCGKERSDNLGGEDIFMSKFENNQWSKPERLQQINTPENHEAPLSISADGNTMLIYNNSDIYFTTKTRNGWTPKEKFPMINAPKDWDADAMVTADGKAVLFISDREGNIGRYHQFNGLFHGANAGNLDIYVSVLTNNGWSKPQNLGKTINTPYAERSPFLHPDMKTLYFSSDGHAGLGRLDVFKSTRLYDTSWIYWSEPINLGKEINSHQDDYDYRISTDGTFAFFSKSNNNNYDIFVITIPEKLRPEIIATIYGKVTDSYNNVLDAEIKWEDLETQETIGISKCDPIEGTYFITMPLGKNYGFYVNKTGYYPQSGNIDLRNKHESISIEKNFVLVSIQDIINKQIPIPLENIFFDFNKSTLKTESLPELYRLLDFIKQNPKLKIELSGHTDNIGEPNYNKQLSESRAQAVLNFLIKNGADANLVISVGYGATKPITTNNTEEGRSKNRRVEFKVIK